VAVAAYVYEVYEADPTTGLAAEHPIYVGVTGSFAARRSAHLHQSWWSRHASVLCVILTGYGTRSEARMVEAALIEHHAPRFNRKPERKYPKLAREVGLIDPDLDTAPLVAAELSPTHWGER
jgi:hypothetical protein